MHGTLAFSAVNRNSERSQRSELMRASTTTSLTAQSVSDFSTTEHDETTESDGFKLHKMCAE